jgi:hypothetical protein
VGTTDAGREGLRGPQKPGDQLPREWSKPCKQHTRNAQTECLRGLKALLQRILLN